MTVHTKDMERKQMKWKYVIKTKDRKQEREKNHNSFIADETIRTIETIIDKKDCYMIVSHNTLVVGLSFTITPASTFDHLLITTNLCQLHYN